MAKSYSSSAILKHLKAGTECACLAVFETCRPIDYSRAPCLGADQKARGLWERDWSQIAV